ncbi:MAG TPA: TonB-dependent receptor [Gammaproteobacteria bacterium]|nr:TonB-dependent receptor [Gammaproteobacteria bacterium]
MRTRNRSYAAVAAIAVVTLFFMDLEIASAQIVPDEEVIVTTARRRAESFQDVPITITAFSEEDIAAAGIERPQDFVSLTPNVTLVETQNQGTSFLTIRGISQARNSEPSAAILVDGVLLTNPAQLTQELFDVQQIEVLKGAQGAVYGRNAIGGAIVITTREPDDEFEGRVKLGYDDGPGFNVGASAGGPVGDSDVFKYQASLSYYDTDGWIDNTFLNEEADPFRDISLRARLLWEPTDRLRTDARVYLSEVETQALYFNIDFGNNVNNTSIPVRVNNRGVNDRDLSQLAFKVDYDADWGTFTSITSLDSIEELLTGDQFNFLPIDESLFFGIFGIDWAQSQFLDVDTISQEIRFTSTSEDRLRWIGGMYFTQTDRFISTANTVDRNSGATPVFRSPVSPASWFVDPSNDQITYLADGQDNFAWAIFGELAYDISDRTEIAVALRYDEDERENTTLTPGPFLPTPDSSTGEVRKRTWDELQPRVSLRFRPSDSLTVYGSVGRGFRSGGFNQTGVGADPGAQALGVVDLFDAEVADTVEVGVKSQLSDRVDLNFSVFDTEAEGSYFFLFLATSSTQNLGSLGQVDYQGFELDLSASLTDNLDLMFGYGYTDSEIKRDSPYKDPLTPSAVGNQAPLVTEDTINLTLQYHVPFGSGGKEFVVRGDYQRIGDTWWDPANTTVRDPVNLLDVRFGVQSDDWSVMAWGRNINDVEYNTEWSPGGFLFKAKPARYGVDFTKRF